MAAISSAGADVGGFCLHRPDGTTRETEFNAIALWAAPSRSIANVVPGLHLSILRDISERARLKAERKQAEATVRDSEERYRLMFESNPNPMWFYDPDTLVFLEVNQAAIAHYGYSREEFLQMTIADMHPPGDVPALRLVNNHLTPQQPHVEIWQHYKKDGSVIDVEVNAHAFSVAGRQANLVLMKDITELKRMEAERQQAEAVIRESEERFRNMTDHMPVMIWVTDPTGYCTYLSQSWYDFSGQTEETGLGFGWLDALHPDDRERSQIIFLTANERHETFQIEYRFRRHDGEYRWAIDAGAKAGSWDWNLATGKLTWSPETYHLHGLDPADGFPQYEDWYNDLLYPGDRQRVSEYLSQVLEQCLPEIQIEFRIVHPQLGIRWLLSLGRLTVNEQGEPMHLSGINLDISERQAALRDRKQAEQKIAEQAAFIDIATDAIFVQDLDNRILFWNQGAERLYGWTAAEVLGKIAHELFNTESSSQLAEGLNLIIEQGFWQGELEQVTKTGQEIIAVSRWTLVRDESGQPKSILVVNTDITEKKKLEQQFYHAQRLESIGTLASGIAHDFNNILTPILVIAQLLPLKLPNLNEQTRRLLTMLEDSAKRGSHLVKQLLSLSRGTEGERVMIQLQHLLSELVTVVQSTFPKSINISRQIPTSELWLISADSTQIHQVFMNILINARDAMPNSGRLAISAENRYLDEHYARMNLEAHVGSYVVITISDTGTGIPQEVMERIFDPFFTTKEVGKGTGLGLATVLGIVKNHGGFVKVYSEVPKGTKFEVFLPAVAGELSQPNPEDELPRGNGELILIVDDEEIIRETTKTSLEKYNYKTLLARDGIEAIAIYAKRKDEISVVLMDLMMPNLDGLTTIHIMQRMNPQVKVILTSGLPANAQKTFPVNIKTFLLKPYTIKELLECIAGL
ncbi:MAG: PAS domain S-box protein [Scytonema sp. RU_4_4]|nr:PAS domain S-box protein [Scytonema sp. RU_4_4]